jgi:hypothetical protein
MLREVSGFYSSKNIGEDHARMVKAHKEETGVVNAFFEIISSALTFITYTTNAAKPVPVHTTLHNNSYFSFYCIKFKSHRKMSEIKDVRLDEIRVLCYVPVHSVSQF